MAIEALPTRCLKSCDRRKTENLEITPSLALRPSEQFTTDWPGFRLVPVMRFLNAVCLIGPVGHC